MITLFIWIICGFVCYSMAEKRNREPALGFMAGMLFGVFAVIYYALAGEKK